MFGQEPGNERRMGAMNQSVVTKLESNDATYFVLHTKGENARSVFITEITAHYKKSKAKPGQPIEMDRVNHFVNSSVSSINTEKEFTVKDYERAKDTTIVRVDSSQSTLEAAVNAATRSCILGVIEHKEAQ